MKIKLVLRRNYTSRYSSEDFTMEQETKVIEVELNGIENDHLYGSGDWQILGYEEITK